jgi:hypothetical protein
MKKERFILMTLLCFLALSTFVAAQTTNTATSTTNPISDFMQKEITSEAFKIIGAPENVLFQNLIIYILFVLIAYLVVTDLLNGVSLFEKNWINYAIGLIVVLLGVYSGAAYNLILAFTKIQFIGMAATGITYYLILAILAGYLVIRTLLKIIRRSKRTSQEKAEERASKIETLRKIQDIEAKARGIE